MLDITNPLLCFRRSESFPKEYELGGEVGTGPLKPILLNYTQLTKVIHLSFDMVATGKWRLGQGLTYMTDNCINKKFAHVHLSRATNRWNLEKAKLNDRDTVRAEALIADQIENPKRYSPLTIPSLFTRGVPLHAFTDTPMHLIPLGIGRATFFRIMTWSGRRGRKKAFVSIAKALMEDLNSLKLKWMTLLPNTIKDKWGGWVSKNYSSLLRVALWVFAPLMTIDNAVNYVDPTEEPKKWTVKMMQGWLRARELDHKGKRKELLERVLPFFETGAIIPPIVPEKYSSANEMIEMLQSLVLMVGTLFQKSVHQDCRNILELRIRVFLTRFQRFDEPMRKEGKLPNWLVTYNFMCLLNLPETIQEFGPIRQWYEGKWLGERYVATVKSERLKCPLNNLHYILLRNLQRNKSIDNLNQKKRRNDEEEQLPTNTKVHSNEDDLMGSFMSGMPFPVVKTNDGCVYGLFYNSDKKSLKQVMQRRIDRHDIEPPGNFQYGLNYWKFVMADERSVLIFNRIIDYGILLAKHGNEDPNVYTVVWKNWSTDMFGDYDYTKEACHEDQTFAKVDMMETDDYVGTTTATYNEDYYNEQTINFKREDLSDDSDSPL
jgi:hypothetical protein